MSNLYYTHYFFYSKDIAAVEGFQKKFNGAILADNYVLTKNICDESVYVLNSDNDTEKVMKNLGLDTSMLKDYDYSTVTYFFEQLYVKDGCHVFEVCCEESDYFSPNNMLEIARQLGVKVAFVTQDYEEGIFMKLDRDNLFCPEKYVVISEDVFFDDKEFERKLEENKDIKALLSAELVDDDFLYNIFGTVDVEKIQEYCHEKLKPCSCVFIYKYKDLSAVI